MHITKTQWKLLNYLTTTYSSVIVGATALSYHGYSRATKDVDILSSTKDAKQVLQTIKEAGYSLTKNHWSHWEAEKGKSKLDLLFTHAEEYSNTFNKDDKGFTTKSGLLDMYLLSDKEQNQFDALNLLRLHPTTKPSQLVTDMEQEKWTNLQEAIKHPEKQFKPRSLIDDFNLAELEQFL